MKPTFSKTAARTKSGVRKALSAVRCSWILDMCNTFSLSLYRVEGREKNSGAGMTLLFAGEKHQAVFYSDRVFGEEYSIESLGESSIIDIASKGDTRHPCDLLVVCAHHGYGFLFRNRLQYRMPEWVYGELDFPGGIQGLVSKTANDRRGSLRRNISIAMKQEFTYALTKERKDFDYFYETMYLPYKTMRHRDNSYTWDYKSLSDEDLKRYDLLYIYLNGIPCAGAVHYYFPRKNYPFLLELGVLTGDTDYVRLGAFTAAYYYSIMHFEKKGYSKMSLGRTRSFLNDGVLQYKRRWSMKIISPQKNRFFIVPAAYTEGVVSFMNNNPFITEENGRLVSNVFLAENEEYDVKKKEYIDTNYLLPGLSELRLFRHTEGKGFVRFEPET